MSPEPIGIIAVGIALADLILNGQRRIDARFERLEKRVTALEVRQAALRNELLEQIAGLRTELIERGPCGLMRSAELPWAPRERPLPRRARVPR